MDVQFFSHLSPNEIAEDLVAKMKERRHYLKLSQVRLAEKSGVSLASIKRFEQRYEISLISFIKIAIALNLDHEFSELFVVKKYNFIKGITDGKA